MSNRDQNPDSAAAHGRRRTAAGIAAALALLLDRLVSFALSGVIMLVLMFTVLSITDLSEFNARGMESVKNRDLKQLMKINPDTAAWLILDGTHIDYPVVQGKDNFEYLDLDFYRNFYAGGSLFLDHENSKDFSDRYNVIHGHHMSEGAMFGDLDKFLDRDFLDENHSGTLMTPSESYSLEIAASGTADAYDTAIYNVKGKLKDHIKAVLGKAACIRDKNALKSMMGSGRSSRVDDKDEAAGMLVLSTCTGAMDDSRTIVVCIMYPDIERNTANGRDDV